MAKMDFSVAGFLFSDRLLDALFNVSILPTASDTGELSHA